MVLLQIVFLGQQYKIINLLQIPVGILFGIFLTLSGKVIMYLPDPGNPIIRIILMLVSTVFVAVGVFLYVPAGFIPLAPEGFLLALSKVTKLKISTAKIISDVTMVFISLGTCLMVIHSLGSVGIGTIVAALLVGSEVKWITKIFGKSRDKMLGIHVEKICI